MQSPAYNVTTSFATDETNQASGRSTVRTAAIDIEHANISTSVNSIIANLNILQRDDGKLKDGIVEPYALSESARAILSAKGRITGDYASNFNYLVGDLVRYINTSYICAFAHTSTSTFLNAFFLPITGDGTSLINAQNAALSEANALASKNSALASASSSTANATSATSSAASASTSATSATNSASIATSSAASAVASANAAAISAASLLIRGSEYLVATGTSSAYAINPVIVITSYAVGQIYEVQFPVTCIDNPTMAVSGLAAKNIVVLADDGTFQNAVARDIVGGGVSTLESIDVGSGVVKLLLKDPAVVHSNLTSVSANTAFTIATALSKVIKSTGSAARQHTLPVFSTWPIEGRFDLIAENTSMQIARQNAGDVIDYYGVNLATDGVTGAFIDVPLGTQITFIKTATSWQITALRYVITNTRVATRQAIQYGAITATGQPDLITQAQVGNTIATGVTTNGTFFASVGNGFNADGSQNNVNKVRTTPLSFPNLTASSTNYLLYNPLNDTGSFVTLVDIFQAGGTISTVNNQLTYDYLNHIMYSGNGGGFGQVNLLVIAEVDTSATVVTAIRVRAYNGKADSGYTNTLVGAAGTYTKNHNMGTNYTALEEVVECITADAPFSVGDLLSNPTSYDNTRTIPPSINILKNTVVVRRSNTNGYVTSNPTTGALFTLTSANWKYKTIATRRF